MNTSVMSSEYLTTDAFMVCSTLQPKGKEKLHSSEVHDKALDLHAFWMFCILAVV